MWHSSDWWVSLCSGAMAGVAVDLTLFPLDTLKTRLQSHLGFWRAGGFTNIFAGVGPAAAGSAPSAAVFFVTYDTLKTNLLPLAGESKWLSIWSLALSASLAETSSCLVRVPVEVLKQRRQIGSHGSVFSACRSILSSSEGFLGFYRGFTTTVCREIPFAIIQLPLWEGLKVLLSNYSKKQSDEGTKKGVTVVQSSMCGATAGGIAAALTNPLDVAKTRIMLAEPHSKLASASTMYALRQLYIHEGVLNGLMAGVVPRCTAIAIGGAVFFGAYEQTRHFITHSMTTRT